MKEHKDYVLRVGDVVFPVTEKGYRDYYRALERWKYIKKQERGKSLSYERALADGLPVDTPEPESLADAVETRMMIETMLRALGQLPKADQALIRLLFFDEMTTRRAAAALDVDQSTVVRRKEQILQRIRRMMDV